MKFIFLASLIAITAQAQSAPELPNYLKEQLDESSGATAFQLTVNDTIERIAAEKNYRENITTQVNRDLKGWETAASVAQGALGSLTVLGFPASFVAVTSGDEFTKSGSSIKYGIETAHLSGAAVGSSVVGGLGFAGMDKIVHIDVVTNVLNDTKADEYAASTASHLAKFFQLPKNKEMALKFAIKEEIYRKNKAKDLSPIDMQEILKNAKFSGQPVLSEKEAQAFAKIQAELLKTKPAKDAKPKGPTLSPDEEIGYLISANAMLEVQLDINAKKQGNDSPEMHKVQTQIAKNRKLLHELNEFKRTQNPSSQKDDGEKDPAVIDAE